MDLDAENLAEAALFEKEIKKALKKVKKKFDNVNHYEFQVKDRRGDNKPDISKMKFRSN